jgi:predicted Zn-dependent protease
MPTMFERLARQYRYDAKPPEFLLTHPVTESRIADTRNRAEQAPQGGVEDSLRYQLIRARVQLTYEGTPGLAAKRFRAQLDENPQMDAARYGLALAQIKGGQLNEARESLKPLLAKAPNDITYNLAQIDLDITNNRLADAQQRAERLQALYPGNYPLKQVRADLLVKQASRPRRRKCWTIWSRAARTIRTCGTTWPKCAACPATPSACTAPAPSTSPWSATFDQAIQQLDYAKRRSGSNFPLASQIDQRQREIMEQQRMVKDMMGRCLRESGGSPLRAQAGFALQAFRVSSAAASGVTDNFSAPPG